MKEKLISLAKEKGFESTVIGKSATAKYSKKPFYYLWLCELQRWLRAEHNIHVYIASKTQSDGTTVFIPHGRTIPDTIKNSLIVDIIKYSTHLIDEEALEKGLQEALNLI